MTPKRITFGSNRNIRRYRYYNYIKDYSNKYINAIDDFLDYSAFNRWRELLEENNYNKRGRPYKIPGIVIMYLAQLRELRGIPFRWLETERHNLSKIFRFPETSFTSITTIIFIMFSIFSSTVCSIIFSIYTRFILSYSTFYYLIGSKEVLLHVI